MNGSLDMSENPIVDSLFARKSTREFLDRPVPREIRDRILDCAIQAPTAGNQALYAIIEVSDQGLKDELADSCDRQAFIAKAPLVLVFVADCLRWLDCYRTAGVEAREPGPGDFLLACEDALIAAQNAVVAAEASGLGSCYIGDILENRERVVGLLGLDRRTVPVAMLVMGYPTEPQRSRAKPPRLARGYLVHENRYRRREPGELRAMVASVHAERGFDFDEYMKAFCARKYESEFMREMNRSAAAYLEAFGASRGDRDASPSEAAAPSPAEVRGLTSPSSGR